MRSPLSRLVIGSFVCSTLAVGSFGGVLSAQETDSVSRSPERFASRYMQDETNELPSENTAFFTAAGEVKLKLDLLDAMSGLDEDVLVTVIRPDGQSREFTAGADSTVTIDQAEVGPHAIVASGKGTHGTTLLYFEDAKSDPFVDSLEKDFQAADLQPARMTLFQVDPNELMTLVDEATGSGPGGDASSRTATLELDDDIRTGGSFGFRVSLDDDGVLRGQVMSIAKREGGVSLAGTQIVIFFEGAPVGATTCDAGGLWKVDAVRPGVHGLIAVGPAGYAAMAFEATEANNLAGTVNRSGTTLVRADTLQAAPRLPVVLVPPAMVPAVSQAITSYYPARPTLTDPGAGAAGAEAIAGAMSLAPSVAGIQGLSGGQPAGPGNAGPGGGGAGGAGAGGAGAGGAAGGIGGLGGLAALGAVGAVAATSLDDDDDPVGPVASPFIP